MNSEIEFGMTAGDFLPGAIDVGSGPDVGFLKHKETLPRHNVSLREFHGPDPLRRIGDETDVGIAAGDRIDHGFRVGQWLEFHRHADTPRQFARHVGGSAADGTGRVPHCLRRIAAQIGRSQCTTRRDVAVGGQRRLQAQQDQGEGCQCFHDFPAIELAMRGHGHDRNELVLAVLAHLPDMVLRVELEAEFRDEIELRLEEIDVMFLV